MVYYDCGCLGGQPLGPNSECTSHASQPPASKKCQGSTLGLFPHQNNSTQFLPSFPSTSPPTYTSNNITTTSNLHQQDTLQNTSCAAQNFSALESKPLSGFKINTQPLFNYQSQQFESSDSSTTLQDPSNLDSTITPIAFSEDPSHSKLTSQPPYISYPLLQNGQPSNTVLFSPNSSILPLGLRTFGLGNTVSSASVLIKSKSQTSQTSSNLQYTSSPSSVVPFLLATTVPVSFKALAANSTAEKSTNLQGETTEFKESVNSPTTNRSISPTSSTNTANYSPTSPSTSLSSSAASSAPVLDLTSSNHLDGFTNQHNTTQGLPNNHKDSQHNIIIAASYDTNTPESPLSVDNIKDLNNSNQKSSTVSSNPSTLTVSASAEASKETGSLKDNGSLNEDQNQSSPIMLSPSTALSQQRDESPSSKSGGKNGTVVYNNHHFVQQFNSPHAILAHINGNPNSSFPSLTSPSLANTTTISQPSATVSSRRSSGIYDSKFFPDGFDSNSRHSSISSVSHQDYKNTNISAPLLTSSANRSSANSPPPQMLLQQQQHYPLLDQSPQTMSLTSTRSTPSNTNSIPFRASPRFNPVSLSSLPTSQQQPVTPQRSQVQAFHATTLSSTIVNANNSLDAFLERFSAIGETTRGVESMALSTSESQGLSRHNSRADSFDSSNGRTSPLHNGTTSNVHSPSPSHGVFTSNYSSTNSLWQAPQSQQSNFSNASSSALGSSSSTVVSPMLVHAETNNPSANINTINSAFSPRSGFDAFGTSNPASLVNSPQSHADVRSPFVQSQFSSVFTSPSYTSSSVYAISQQQHQQQYFQPISNPASRHNSYIESTEQDYSYRSPSLSQQGLERTSYVLNRTPPSAARASPLFSNPSLNVASNSSNSMKSNGTSATNYPERNLRQHLVYQQQQQQIHANNGSAYSPSLGQASVNNGGINPIGSPNSAHANTNHRNFKFNPHSTFNQQRPNFYSPVPPHDLPPSTSNGYTSQAQGHFHPGAQNIPPTSSQASGSGPRRSYDVSSGSVRSQLLEEFRGNKLKKYELRDIFGHIVEFSGDQYGSRFIQSKLETATSEEKEIVFNELKLDALQLMKDVFGNYVIQKFFELGNQIQKTILAKQMEGNMLTLSLQMYGCRVVQKAIEFILTEQQARLISELKDHVMQCIQDQNGNHVIQKAIERIPTQYIQFILQTYKENSYKLCIHPYGCRVIQRMLEFGDEETKQGLLNNLHQFTKTIINDQYGNYVLQHVIERGQDEDRDKMIETILAMLVKCSQHKFASNVVEKAIIFGRPEHRLRVVDIILGSDSKDKKQNTTETSPLQTMMKDQYANYVIQKLLERAEPEQKIRLLIGIRPLIEPLKKMQIGKHIAAIEKLVDSYEKEYNVKPSTSFTSENGSN